MPIPNNALCRPANQYHSDQLYAATRCLEHAKMHARQAGCVNLLRKIRSSLKSAEGAKRHMHRRMNRDR